MTTSSFYPDESGQIVVTDEFVPTPFKFTVKDYHKLGEIGISQESSRVELVEGELIDRWPLSGPHVWTVNRLSMLLVPAVNDQA